MITRSPIYNVARSLTSSQYEFIEREFGYSKTSFLDLPDETLVDIYYDLCDIEATALTRKRNSFHFARKIESQSRKTALRFQMVPLTGIEPVRRSLFGRF